ncbi:hypothetical protein [Bryocella elongata]|uniref:hypothetical protein n=1 Tax=Bryocella elongata TaxID=863522 RepID=UPI000CDED0BD|nr:hypothetical protein [Bryocella elongata]
MNHVELLSVEFVSLVDNVDPDDDNVDVHIHLRDGRAYSLLAATPKNIYRCMRDEGSEHFFSDPPPLLVNFLDEAHVRAAIEAMLVEKPDLLVTYGVLQSTD